MLVMVSGSDNLARTSSASWPFLGRSAHPIGLSFSGSSTAVDEDAPENPWLSGDGGWSSLDAAASRGPLGERLERRDV